MVDGERAEVGSTQEGEAQDEEQQGRQRPNAGALARLMKR